MAIASPFNEKKKGLFKIEMAKSSPFKEKKGLFKIEMSIASPFKETQEGSLHDRNGDSFPFKEKTEGSLQHRNGDRSLLQRKKRRVSSIKK